VFAFNPIGPITDCKVEPAVPAGWFEGDTKLSTIVAPRATFFQGPKKRAAFGLRV
jgi:hypothetical protein